MKPKSPRPTKSRPRQSSPRQSSAHSSTAGPQPTEAPTIDFRFVESTREVYLSQRRRAICRSLLLTAVATAIILITILLGSSTMTTSPLPATIFGILSFAAFLTVIISAIIMALATGKSAAAYKRAYKAYFVERSLAATFTHLRYDHTAGLDRNLLRSTGMLTTGDVYHSNDLVVAQYHGVKFLEADVHIQDEYTDSDGDTHYVTRFKGRFMIFEFPRKFNFRLELIGKRFKVAKVPRRKPQPRPKSRDSHEAKSAGDISSPRRPMSRLSTESIEFNRSFKIFAEDGLEAFYLLDPTYITKIQQIADTYQRNLFFGFLDNYLIVGLHDGKDAFEPPSPRRPLDEQTELARVHADIQVITDLVDLLQLDRGHHIFQR